MGNGTIRIGTSGWHYDHWVGPFYPEQLPRDERLGFYGNRLGSVEINNTYYGMPSDQTLRDWAQTVPDGFLFAVKAHGYITHRKKLKDPGDTLPSFLKAIRQLGDALGPVLYQLPPRWRANPQRLDTFLETIPGDAPRSAFEFRDRSWMVDEVRDVLERHDAAFCIYERAGYESPRWVTSDSLVYIRLHGPGDAYEGSYDRATLSGWKRRIEEWSAKGLDVFVFFDNDQDGYAADNAETLSSLLDL
jgi:uncharacterized protein YecE (DUF72 family)